MLPPEFYSMLNTICAVTAFVFVSSFVVLYILMQLSCYFKRHYCPPRNIICMIICGFLNMIMCDKCREGCTNHRKLVMRAIMFSILTTIATLAGYLLPLATE